MLGRTLGSAALALAVCFSVSASVQAQNLEAGKSPAQIFNGACAACHKSPRGLVKSVPASSLPGFLRQHYTTSSDMAGALSSYLLANGGVDRRPGAAEKPRRGREAGPATAAPAAVPQPAPAQNNWWPFRREPAGQTAAPDSAGPPPNQKPRTKHKKKSKAAPAQEAAPQQPPHAVTGSDDAKSDTPKSDSAKPERAGSPGPKSEPANTAPVQRPDPVPAVTPAAEPKSAEPKSAEPNAVEPKASEPKPSESKPSDAKTD